MEKIIINKTFKSLKECEEWEDKNFPDRTYNGRMIFMINHSSTIGDNSVTIESIVVL